MTAIPEISPITQYKCTSPINCNLTCVYSLIFPVYEAAVPMMARPRNKPMSNVGPLHQTWLQLTLSTQGNQIK